MKKCDAKFYSSSEVTETVKILQTTTTNYKKVFIYLKNNIEKNNKNYKTLYFLQ